ncbi:MAG: response regulator transcription factor [Dehalococcoidales bacterium]|nr:response regulator transcription factor [Dehalococcoidales bacterium]MDZ4230647.1 response regulator transcription factor [Dehalococcoidales bacterium]
MGKIRILVVDDHQVVREGLRRMLGQEEDIELVGQGANSEEALFQIEILSPDIVLMDIKMPGVDGIEITRQLTQQKYPCKVIMLTFYDEYINNAMEAGAKGYLLKDTKREELLQSIRRVYRGEVVVGQSVITNPRNGYEGGRGLMAEARLPERPVVGDTMLEEVLLVLPPPVDAGQLMRFASEVEEALDSRVLQVVGSWHEGTALTISLARALQVTDILARLTEMAEIKAIEEEPPSGETNTKLIQKATAVPRLRDKLCKTIFVTLGDGAMVS